MIFVISLLVLLFQMIPETQGKFSAYIELDQLN